MPSTKEVQDELLRILGAEIQRFDQASVARAAGLGDRVGQGFCYGMCLDWARRVMQARKSHKAFQFQSAGGARFQAQVERQLAFHAQQKQTKLRVDSTFTQSQERRNLQTAKQSLIAFLRSTLTLNPEVDEFPFDALFPQGHESNWTDTGLPLQSGTVFSRDQLTRLANGLEQKVDHAAIASYELRLREGPAQEVWTLMKATLGAQLQAARGPGDGASSRPFSNVQLVNSIAPTESARGASYGACVRVLLSDPAFTSGRCAIFSFELKPGQATGEGHATAIFKAGENCAFLDPNFGIFKGPLSKLQAVYDYLLGSASTDGAYADERPTGRYDYAILAVN